MWKDWIGKPMGLIIDGNLEIGAQVRRKLCHLKFHSIRSRAVANPIFFSPKD